MIIRIYIPLEEYLEGGTLEWVRAFWERFPKVIPGGMTPQRPDGVVYDLSALDNEELVAAVLELRHTFGRALVYSDALHKLVMKPTAGGITI